MSPLGPRSGTETHLQITSLFCAYIHVYQATSFTGVETKANLCMTSRSHAGRQAGKQAGRQAGSPSECKKCIL